MKKATRQQTIDQQTDEVKAVWQTSQKNTEPSSHVLHNIQREARQQIARRLPRPALLRFPNWGYAMAAALVVLALGLWPMLQPSPEPTVSTTSVAEMDAAIAEQFDQFDQTLDEALQTIASVDAQDALALELLLWEDS